MRITKIEVVQLLKGTTVHVGSVGWLWVRIHTSDGLVGLGETFPAVAAEKAVVLGDLAPVLIGRDPTDIEALWRDMFNAVQFRGWGGAEIRAISAVDLALWDLLGKAANLPVFRLLGGRCWESIRVYNTCYDDKFSFLTQPVELARDLAARGIRGMKIWPFDDVARRNRGQFITSAEMEQCVRPVRQIREALGDEMQIMLEFHGYWNLPCAVEIARALEPYNVTWLEEMLPQDNLGAYKTLAGKVRQPLCVSERLATRWGYRELFESGFSGMINMDVEWCGGLSEARKIANWADTYYLPVCPHNCGGPVGHFASWHLAMASPNLYILETVRRHYEDRFAGVVTSTGAPQNGALGLPPGPGLGVELDPALLASDRVAIE